MDPTKKDAGIPSAKDFKRSVGAIFIAYDPNTGNLNIKTEGLLPIEEIGAIQWAMNLRLNAHMAAIAESNEGKIIQ